MKERRNFGRIHFASQLTLTSADQTYQGTLLDLAMKGCLVEFDPVPPLQQGSPCHVSIQLNDSDLTLEFDAVAIHFEGAHIGLKFTELDISTLTHLRRLLELNTGDAERVEQELHFLTRNDAC